MQDSTNTRDLDKKFVQTPRTQPGYVGKFSIFIVVLIFLFTFQNVNNKIKTTTENLPTQAGCVPGIPTDFLSKSLVFVESCMILWVDTSYLYCILTLLSCLLPNFLYADISHLSKQRICFIPCSFNQLNSFVSSGAPLAAISFSLKVR